jgi:hypothetical protein
MATRKATRTTASRKVASVAKTAKRRTRKSSGSIIETVKSVIRRVKGTRKRKAKP